MTPLPYIDVQGWMKTPTVRRRFNLAKSRVNY